MERVVVVGGGLAGLRAAEAIRESGFDGSLQVVGAERHLPYTKPPLSKGFLTGSEPPEVGLRIPDDLDIGWVLGDAAGALDTAAQIVHLQSGHVLRYDGLVLATGAIARPWPGGPVPAGVYSLRTLDDAALLRDLVQGPPLRIVVVGAGFIGGEFVSSARALGHAVSLVDLAAQPLQGVLGSTVGAALADLHRSCGVGLYLGCGVDVFETRSGKVCGVRLTSGQSLPADVCVLALGGVPEVAWLVGSGLDVRGGVLCGADLAVVGTRNVVAAGDVVRWPHRLFGDEPVNVGHWSNATAQGRHAGRTLIQGDGVPFVHVPSFWSAVHGVSIRSIGLPALADEVQVLDGDPRVLDADVGYLRRGVYVGFAGINRRVDAFTLELGERAEPGDRAETQLVRRNA